MFKIALCEDFPSILSKYIDQNHCSNKSVAYLTLIWWSILESFFFLWIFLNPDWHICMIVVGKNFLKRTQHIVLKIVKKVQSGENHTLLFAKISIFFFFQTEWFPKGGKMVICFPLLQHIRLWLRFTIVSNIY